MSVFIGELIREVTDLKGIPKAELGRRLNMSSTNVHKIFKRASIDTSLLEKISEVLDYNFFLHFYLGEKPMIVQGLDDKLFAEDSSEQYKTAIELYQEKIAMLEKINALQDDKIARLEGKSVE